MKTSKPTPARVSKTGHYGIQYPDLEATGLIVPRDTQLQELRWIGGGSHEAFLWLRKEGPAVVWIEREPLKDFE
jgi:hypothetical protein